MQPRTVGPEFVDKEHSTGAARLRFPTGVHLGLAGRWPPHRVRLLRARRRRADRNHERRRHRPPRDHIRSGHPRCAVVVARRPSHRVRLLTRSRPRDTRLRDPSLDDARRRQPCPPFADAAARVRRRAQVCAQRPPDRLPESDLNANRAGFCDPSVDARIERAFALETSDPKAANRLWAQIDREIVDQAPWLPTLNQNTIDFMSARVGNYQFHPQWGLLLDQLWVK
jgi:hypothetical protein